MKKDIELQPDPTQRGVGVWVDEVPGIAGMGTYSPGRTGQLFRSKNYNITAREYRRARPGTSGKRRQDRFLALKPLTNAPCETSTGQVGHVT